MRRVVYSDTIDAGAVIVGDVFTATSLPVPVRPYRSMLPVRSGYFHQRGHHGGICSARPFVSWHGVRDSTSGLSGMSGYAGVRTSACNTFAVSQHARECALSALAESRLVNSLTQL
jgi:hypothetical protein